MVLASSTRLPTTGISAARIRRRSQLLGVPAASTIKVRTQIPIGIKSPLRTGKRTTLLRGRTQASSINAPLNSTMATGRATSYGTSSVSRVPSTPLVRPLRNVTNLGSQTERRPIGGKAATVKKPSEVEILRQKVKELEEKEAEAKQMSATNSELVTMLREKEQAMKEELSMKTQKIETLSTKLSVLDYKVETLEASNETNVVKIKALVKQLDEKESTLRVLHNSVVDLRGQIRVAIRVRPFLPSESDISAINYPSRTSISLDQTTKFEFENVFSPVFKQSDVFEKLRELILSCLHGYNVGLIAFGQTGSGKTYTMRGGSDDESEGIIPRTARFLFQEAEKLEQLGWKFEFSLSFIEIYNNETYDLLNKRQKLKLRLSNQDVSIDGLTEHQVKNADNVNGFLNISDMSRKTAATKCNEQSSRSHAVFQWNVKAVQESTGISTTSVLKLVDLAGSERAKESGVTGEQFKEMTNINQSLSCLQKCISLQKTKSSHVPYRETKLTQLLKDCLGAGNSKTMVIVNINPLSCQMMESKRSIEFAAKMRDTKIGTALQQRDMNETKSLKN